MRRPLIFAALAAASFAAVVSAASSGAEPVKTRPKPHAAPHVREAGAPETGDAGPSHAPTAPTPIPSDAGVVTETRAGDGGTKVFRFGEVEIEGRLKSPQLVYFLRRVRAEFRTTDLGHRTFLPELSETRRQPEF